MNTVIAASGAKSEGAQVDSESGTFGMTMGITPEPHCVGNGLAQTTGGETAKDAKYTNASCGDTASSAALSMQGPLRILRALRFPMLRFDAIACVP